MRKLIAAVFLALGTTGLLAAVVPTASAQVPVRVSVTVDGNDLVEACLLRANVTLFGNHIGSGEDCTL